VAPTGRRGWWAEIASPLCGNARVNAPGQERAEQQDRTEIAVRQQMRESPGLDAGQHRMLGSGADMAWDVGRGDEDHRNEHQPDGDVMHERRWRPDLNPAGRAVMRVTPDNQDKAEQRGQRKQRTIPEAETGNRGGARFAERHKGVGAEKDHKPGDEENKTYCYATLLRRGPLCSSQ